MLKKKIFVIGPLVPYTGGVAQSNTVLCNNLAQNNDVIAISYSLMYPKFLYPGKKQIDGEYLKKTKFKQEFILNTINPLSWIKILAMAGKQKPDWIVFQWWHTYFFPSYFFITIFSKLFYRTKINVVCHHVLPYEGGLAKKLIHIPLTKLFLGSVTHAVTLSESELAMLFKTLPKSNSHFMLENSFSYLLRPPVSKEMARKKLELPNKKILLSFGAVRFYKGVEDLLEALSILSKKRKDLFLVVAGAFWEPVETYEKLAISLGIRDNVKFVNKYIPDEEVPFIFCSSDLVVLSHRSASQSAIPQLAFEYKVPMVATNVGGNNVYVDTGVSGFIIPPKNPKKMAEAIEKFFNKKLSSKFVAGMEIKKKMLDWSEDKEKLFFGEINS